MRLLVSTDKGLLVYDLKTEGWQLRKIHFMGMPVSATLVDHRSGLWWTAINHKHWGPKLHFSQDEGINWQEVKTPQFPDKYNLSLKSIWIIASSPNDNSSRFYLGVEPAGLFVTEDGGKNFSLISGLSDHPTREQWLGGGKGSNNPFLHTLNVDHEDKNHLYVGISCAGVFQSYDGGNTWEPTNEGIEAFYSPSNNGGIGHDPHVLRIARTNPNVIWQQNHCGIYVSKDKGVSWRNVSAGHAKYGFALVVDEDNENRAWVVPAQSDDLRIPYNNALAVYKTEDGGDSWIAQTSGLPQKGSFDLVLRRGMDINKNHIVFGTNNGNLYHSENYGEHWQVITQNLASVRQVVLVN